MVREAPIAAAAGRAAPRLLWAIVAFSPLPFGSADPWASALLVIGLGIAVCLACARPIAAPLVPRLGLVLVPLASGALVLALQTLLPATHEIWGEAEAALIAPLRSAPTIAKGAPVRSFGAPLAAALAFIAGALVASNRHRGYMLLAVVSWSGAIYAVLAIASFVVSPETIFGREKLAYRADLTTPFVNRNTAAMYYGSCAIVGLTLMWRDWRDRPRRTVARVLDRRLVWPAARLCLCLLAMLMTASRAGIILSLGALAVTALLLIWRPRASVGRTAAACGIVVLGILVGLQVFGGALGNRLSADGGVDSSRAEVYRAALGMIAERPLLGNGLGTFSLAFPAYRPTSISVSGVWDRAHDIPLEIAVDGGVPLALVVTGSWIGALALLLKGRRRSGRGARVAAFGVALATGLHAIPDFSLQIAGLAVPVMALIGSGLALGAARNERRSKTRSRRDHRYNVRNPSPETLSGSAR